MAMYLTPGGLVLDPEEGDMWQTPAGILEELPSTDVVQGTVGQIPMWYRIYMDKVQTYA